MARETARRGAKYTATGVKICDISDNGQYDLYDASEVIGKVNTFAYDQPYISIIKDGSGVGRVRKLPKQTNCLGTMGCIVPRIGNSVDYIFSHLGTKDFSQHIISGAIPHLYFRDYSEDTISLPSLAEQEQIGAFFQVLDELIGAKEEELEKLRQMKAALLEAMFPDNESKINTNGGGYKYMDIKLLSKGLYFCEGLATTPRLRFRGFTDPWQRKKLGEVAKFNPQNDPLQIEFYYIDLEAVDRGILRHKRKIRLVDAPSRAQRTLL